MTANIEKKTHTDFNAVARFYETAVGQVTRQIADSLVKLSPPFSGESKILDNATGTAIVVEEIQARIAAECPDIKVLTIATDYAEAMINICREKAAQQPTPFPNLDLSFKVVAAEDIDDTIIPDNSITHSYMNFALFHCGDSAKAAKHIYRSLAPGGTAFITSWADPGYLNAIDKTEIKPVEFPFSKEWETPSYNKKMLTNAGFDEDKVEVKQEDCLFRAPSVEELAKILYGLVRMMSGRQGEPIDEVVKKDWIERMIGHLENDEHAVRSENEFAMRMTANLVICKK